MYLWIKFFCMWGTRAWLQLSKMSWDVCACISFQVSFLYIYIYIKFSIHICIYVYIYTYMCVCENIQIYVKFLIYWITLLNDAIYTAKIYIDLPNHILLGRDVGDCFLSPQALNLDQVIFRRCFPYLILNICRGRDSLIILKKLSRA